MKILLIAALLTPCFCFAAETEAQEAARLHTALHAWKQRLDGYRDVVLRAIEKDDEASYRSVEKPLQAMWYPTPEPIKQYDLLLSGCSQYAHAVNHLGETYFVTSKHAAKVDKSEGGNRRAKELVKDATNDRSEIEVFGGQCQCAVDHPAGAQEIHAVHTFFSKVSPPDDRDPPGTDVITRYAKVCEAKH